MSPTAYRLPRGNLTHFAASKATPADPMQERMNNQSMLKAQLTDKELAERPVGFAGAEQFMRNAAANGGVCARDLRSSPSFPGRGQIRVDIEVREGKAFVP
jgi:hypothetical protein